MSFTFSEKKNNFNVFFDPLHFEKLTLSIFESEMSQMTHRQIVCFLPNVLQYQLTFIISAPMIEDPALNEEENVVNEEENVVNEEENVVNEEENVVIDGVVEFDNTMIFDAAVQTEGGDNRVYVGPANQVYFYQHTAPR